MTPNRYAVPIDELESGARIPLADQVEEQAEAPREVVDWSSGTNLYGDGMSGDADGE
jgi:hypothetical protein